MAENDGIYEDFGILPENTIVTEAGLAKLLGKDCNETIRRAVDSGELPPPVPLRGKRIWTIRKILEHIENRLDEKRRIYEKNTKSR